MRHVEKAQFVGDVTDLIVPEDAAVVPRPQSFLVEQVPRWTLPTHFHLRPQFQRFVAGGGTIGKAPIDPLTVHYASAHSGYGPLVSGDEGISYLTMRAVSDTGAWYLPEQREHLKLRIKKQQKHAHPSSEVSADDLRKLAAATEETLIPCDEGGLASWVLRLPPNTRAKSPAGADQGGGRFYVVTKGSLRLSADEMQGLATVFVSPEETLDLEAGADGVEVVVLQFPAAALQPAE